MSTWKIYADYEKEEKWLNEMSAKGFALADYFFCRYTFADCRPGEYIYRIELLEYLPGHPVSQKYIQFMAENGVEYVTRWGRWVYFRKKAEDGPFDIYSDVDSKIMHYKRILALFLPILCMELVLGIINLRLGLMYLFDGNSAHGTPANFTAGILLIIIGIFIFITWNSTRLKLKALKQEKMLRE